jgi:hypothetical protein
MVEVVLGVGVGVGEGVIDGDGDGDGDGEGDGDGDSVTRGHRVGDGLGLAEELGWALEEARLSGWHWRLTGVCAPVDVCACTAPVMPAVASRPTLTATARVRKSPQSLLVGYG